MAEFFDMGGYARYVWSAWSVSAVVLVATVVLIRRDLTRTRARLARRLQSRKAAQS